MRIAPLHHSIPLLRRGSDCDRLWLGLLPFAFAHILHLVNVDERAFFVPYDHVRKLISIDIPRHDLGAYTGIIVD